MVGVLLSACLHAQACCIADLGEGKAGRQAHAAEVCAGVVCVWGDQSPARFRRTLSMIRRKLVSWLQMPLHHQRRYVQTDHAACKKFHELPSEPCFIISAHKAG